MAFYHWYRKTDYQAPVKIKSCSDKVHASKVACLAEGNSLILQIRHLQRSESGIYYCAEYYGTFLSFGKGTRLVVRGKEREGQWEEKMEGECVLLCRHIKMGRLLTRIY